MYKLKEEKELLIENSEKSSNSQTIIAYFMFAISIITISLSVAAVQAFGNGVGIFELTTFRFATVALLSAPLVFGSGCGVKIDKSEWITFPLLTLCIFSFYLAYFYASYYVPIGTLAGLNAAVTIASSSTLSICLKNERKWQLYLAAAVALIGVLFLLQPDALFGFLKLPRASPSNYTFQCVGNATLSNAKYNSSSLYAGYLLCIVSGLSMTTAFRLFRRVSQIVHPSVISFHASIGITICSAILMFVLETPDFPSSTYCIALLILQSIGTAIYLILLPYCLKIIHPSVLIIVRSMDLPLQLLFQYTFMSSINTGKGNWLEIIGGIVCLIGCCIGPLANFCKSRETFSYSK